MVKAGNVMSHVNHVHISSNHSVFWYKNPVFCSEPQEGTTGDHERNDLRRKCFERTPKKI